MIAERGHWVGPGRVPFVRTHAANETPVWYMQPCFTPSTILYRPWCLGQKLDWRPCRSCSYLAVVLLFLMLSLIGTSLGMWCLFFSLCVDLSRLPTTPPLLGCLLVQHPSPRCH